MTKYVPLGSSCSAPTCLLADEGRKGPNYPFDWAFSNPEFVLEIIKLCVTDMSSHQIVTQHFFKNKYGLIGPNFASVFDPHPGKPANTDYRIAFPHEEHKSQDNLIESYVRRMDRLKDALLRDKDVIFIWMPPGETPLFDDKPIINTLEPLNDIARIIKSHNPCAKVYVFTDCDFQFSSEIEHYTIEPTTTYGIVAGRVNDILKQKISSL